MGRFRYALKTNPYTHNAYMVLKHQKDRLYRRFSTSGKHHFVNRSKKSEALCIVLAGYKEQLYPAVFGRIAAAATKEMDVCVVSSGLFSPTLDNLCRNHEWSYLSTKRNNVSLVQNMAIELHPHARYVYKLDEDMFICKDYFARLRNAYDHARKGMYRPGVMAPTINLNGFSSYLLLERLGLLDDFAQRFEPLRCETGREHPVERRPDVARYLWGEGGHVPPIDQIDTLLQSDPQREVACPNVFSIGAILFERQLWEEMEYFPVKPNGNSLGQDEVKLCTYCHAHSRPIMVSMNLAAGHLSFRPQNETMTEYFMQHQQLFLPHGDEAEEH